MVAIPRAERNPTFPCSLLCVARSWRPVSFADGLAIALASYVAFTAPTLSLDFTFTAFAFSHAWLIAFADGLAIALALGLAFAARSGLRVPCGLLLAIDFLPEHLVNKVDEVGVALLGGEFHQPRQEHKPRFRTFRTRPRIGSALFAFSLAFGRPRDLFAFAGGRSRLGTGAFAALAFAGRRGLSRRRPFAGFLSHGPRGPEAEQDQEHNTAHPGMSYGRHTSSPSARGSPDDLSPATIADA